MSTAVAAPNKPPSVIYIFSQDREISAPAEIALLFIKAIVGTLEPKIASLICVAASTLPPKVFISKIIALALSFSATEITRFMKGGKPKSIVPLIGTL